MMDDLFNARADAQAALRQISEQLKASELRADALIQALAKNNALMERILKTTADALARELQKARRGTLENELVGVFTATPLKDATGRQNASGTGATLLNVFEQLAATAFSRVRTRTTRAETDRSQQAQTAWAASRGQQQAMMAQWVEKGGRNL